MGIVFSRISGTYSITETPIQTYYASEGSVQLRQISGICGDYQFISKDTAHDSLLGTSRVATTDMAQVYAARRATDGKIFAVKYLYTCQPHNPQSLAGRTYLRTNRQGIERSTQLARTAPHAVAPFEVLHGNSKKSRYYTVEDLPDMSLRTQSQKLLMHLQDERLIGRYYLGKLLNIVKSLSDVGILHADIKPDNFSIKNSDIFITDFYHAQKSLSFWSPGHTPFYSSQKRINTHFVDLQSEIFSLGMTIIDLMGLSIHTYKNIGDASIWGPIWNSRNEFCDDPIHQETISAIQLFINDLHTIDPYLCETLICMINIGSENVTDIDSLIQKTKDPKYLGLTEEEENIVLQHIDILPPDEPTNKSIFNLECHLQDHHWETKPDSVG